MEEGDERMIDTDKYEGHTPAPWDWFPTPNDSHIGHLQRHSNLTRVTAEIKSRSAEDDANAALIADAPLLLAEVKRLRGLLDEIDEQIYSVVDGLPIEKVNLELLRDIMMSYTDEAYQIRGDKGGWIE